MSVAGRTVAGDEPLHGDVGVLLAPPGEPLGQQPVLVGVDGLAFQHRSHRRPDLVVGPGVDRQQGHAAQVGGLVGERQGRLARRRSVDPDHDRTVGGRRGVRRGPRTTTTGHGACVVSATATEPTRRPVKPPSPRSPSTTSAAWAASAFRTGTGKPVTTSCSMASSGATPAAAAAAAATLVAGVLQQNLEVVGTEARIAEVVAGGPAERADQPQRHPSAVCLLGRPADGLERRLGSVDTDHDRPVCPRRVHRRSLLRISGFRNAGGRRNDPSTGRCRARGDEAAQDRPHGIHPPAGPGGRTLIGCDPEGRSITRVDQWSRRLEPSVRRERRGSTRSG